MGTSKQRPRRVRKAASTRASSASMADCRENRHALIAEAAYFKSERRSFGPATNSTIGCRQNMKWINAPSARVAESTGARRKYLAKHPPAFAAARQS
jgi:hypothetical protein